MHKKVYDVHHESKYTCLGRFIVEFLIHRLIKLFKNGALHKSNNDDTFTFCFIHIVNMMRTRSFCWIVCDKVFSGINQEWASVCQKRMSVHCQNKINTNICSTHKKVSDPDTSFQPLRGNCPQVLKNIYNVYHYGLWT